MEKNLTISQIMQSTKDLTKDQIIKIYFDYDRRYGCWGWCSLDKAGYLIDCVDNICKEKDNPICLEIGVYGGKSILPVALELKRHNKGLVYAIDPWSNEDAIVGYENENLNFWENVDLEKYYNIFINSIQEFNLSNRIKVIKSSSDDAPDIKNIDLLYIDGQHTAQALKDAKKYASQINLGGYCVVDDINWGEVGKVPDLLIDMGFELIHYVDYAQVFKRTNIVEISHQRLDHIYREPQFGENWFSYPNLYREMVKKFSSGSKFVEIGSWKGKSTAFMAVEIANSSKNIDFYCVDTWEGGPDHKTGYDLENLYDTFVSNMKPLEKYYTPMKMTSLKAADMFKDESLDFVFIDASHEYEDVKSDIIAWLPKVKVGGVLAGHDYYINGTDWFPGVSRAVNEFFNNKELKFSENCWIYQLQNSNKVTKKILFYGIDSKEKCVNYDFIINYLIPYSENVNFDVDVLSFEDSENTDEKYDIFVYHCIDENRFAHFGYAPSFNKVKDAVIRHSPKIIIQLIDEYWHEHNEIHNSLGNYCNLFLKQHRHHCQIETYTPNTLQIPLGYVNGFFDENKVITLMKDRKYNWSWIGNLKSDRREMINSFMDIPKGIVGLNGAINQIEMFDIYNDSIFVPCGRGNSSLDCWRIYESLLAGAIPVIVANQHEIECVFAFIEVPPFIYADSWEKSANICKNLLSDFEELQKIQFKINEWWKKIMSNIQNQIQVNLYD